MHRPNLTEKELRVMVVDDSSLYRKILLEAVSSIPGVGETSSAPNGEIALKKIPLFHPDILLLDIEMPVLNGIEVLRLLKQSNPGLPVVLISGVSSRSADITIEGLSLGAIDFIPKPSGNDIKANISQIRDGLLSAFGAIKNVGTSAKTTIVQPSSFRSPSLLPTKIKLVGVGISTGGPGALESFLPLLPADFPVPILVVQHMPPMFTASLASMLDRRSALNVMEAEQGQILESGNVYFAPGGRHMLVRKQQKGTESVFMTNLTDTPPINSCRPAVDPLFESLAKTSGPNTLAIVMTGMGRDGLDGVRHVKSVNGYCLTQSAETCTIYGMPMAVDEAGLSDESVALDQLASKVVSITRGS